MISENINVPFKSHDDTWKWFKKELEPALRADESEYIYVTAEEVIRRNQNKN